MIENNRSPFIENNSNENELNYFIEHSFFKQSLKKGESFSTLFENSVGFLIKGTLKVYFSDESGKERLMFILGENTTLYTYTLDILSKRIVASTECQIVYITEDSYHEFLLQSKNNLSSFIKTFTNRYTVALQYSVCSANQSSRAKIYTFVYQMAINFGHTTKDNNVIIKNMPKLIEISSITGVHRSNVTSYIKELEKSKLLIKSGSKYIIPKIADLEKMIHSINN